MILSRIPLIIRVILLYTVFSLAGWQLVSLTDVPAVAYTPRPEKPKPVVIQTRQVVSGKPASITVPRFGIELSVIDGTYDAATDTWTLSDDKAQFATMTDRPNDTQGNTFIYGHNTDRVFARLSGLVKGDTARIKTTNGHVFTYTYTGEQSVQPDNTAILSENPASPRLTLMTCEGLFSQTRRILYFDFKDVT